MPDDPIIPGDPSESGAMPAEAARVRAVANLALLTVTLVACSRPYCRFLLQRTASGDGLVVRRVKPGHDVKSHVVPATVDASTIEAIGRHLQRIAINPRTGRTQWVCPSQRSRRAGNTPPAAPSAAAGGSASGVADAELLSEAGPMRDAQEWVLLQATLGTSPRTGDVEVRLELPLVVRCHPDGRRDVFRPATPHSDQEVWRAF